MRTSTRRTLAAAVLSTVALSVTGLGQQALATYPGANGKIAFTDNRKHIAEVWTMTKTGTNKLQITYPPRENYRPNWTADGTKMVFITIPPNGVQQVFMMNFRGKARQQVTTGTRYWDWPNISPDGTKIVASGFTDGTYHLYTMNTAGGHQREITKPTTSDDIDASFNHDGTKIVFERDFANGDRGIFRMNPDGTHVKRLSATNERATSPSYAPDSMKIVYSHIIGNRGTARVWVMNNDGTGRMALTDNPVGTYYTNPVWAPDGLKIAFLRLQDSTHPSDVYTMNADGSHHERLTDGQFVIVDLDWGVA